MADVSSYVGPFQSETAIELRYDVNLRLLDHLGELAHALDDFYDEITVTPGSSLEMVLEGALPNRITPDVTFFYQAAGETYETFERRTWSVWQLVHDLLGITTVDRLGVRAAFVIVYDTVEEAVRTFREEFFDYYKNCLEGLGKPLEVSAAVRFHSWRAWEDVVPFDLALRTSPIHVLPPLQEALGGVDFAGALLIDMDRYSTEPLPVQQIPEIARWVNEEGTVTAALLGRRLNSLSVGERRGDGSTRIDSA